MGALAGHALDGALAAVGLVSGALGLQSGRLGIGARLGLFRTAFAFQTKWLDWERRLCAELRGLGLADWGRGDAGQPIPRQRDRHLRLDLQLWRARHHDPE